jgi:hypothetical protein
MEHGSGFGIKWKMEQYSLEGGVIDVESWNLNNTGINPSDVNELLKVAK